MAGGHRFLTGAHARKVTRDAAQDGRDALAGIPMRSGSEREPPDTERVVAHAVEPATVVPQVARLADQRARWRQAAVAGRLQGAHGPRTVKGALGPVGGGEPALEELGVTDLGKIGRA